jgi:hypothetical protein
MAHHDAAGCEGNTQTDPNHDVLQNTQSIGEFQRQRLQ